LTDAQIASTFLHHVIALSLHKIKAHGQEAILADEVAAADKLALNPMYRIHPDPKPSQHSEAHFDKIFNHEIAHLTTYGLQTKWLPHEFQ